MGLRSTGGGREAPMRRWMISEGGRGGERKVAEIAG